MFQNSYQNGTYFDLFDPKTSQQKIKNLYRICNVHGNNKIFDKQLKTYVLEFNSSSSKICFPKEQKKDLYLIQQFLTFQILFTGQMAWNIQLVISDLTKTKRRIILSNNAHKVQIKPFFVKIPCLGVKEGIWHNFVVDLYSFIEAFKGQTYRSLDCIYITGNFKLRRIYTTNTRPVQDQNSEQIQKEISFLPKNFYFPPEVVYTTKIVSYEGETILQHLYQPTQSSTKNGSNLMKKSQNRFSTPKTQIVKSQKNVKAPKQKHFLANTNGSQMINRIRKMQQQQQDSQQSQTQKSLKTPQSTDNTINKRKNLIKTQIPPKFRASIQKKKQPKNQQKIKIKSKLNPWRTNPKQIQTDGSQLQISKHQQRNIQSAQTTLFKTKNNLVSKFNESKNRGFDRKSDHYSDSQYVELSQKFSTLTDGKFFKQQPQINQQQEINNNHHQNDQIQQNIQMQTNSIYSKKQQQSPNKPDQIAQSIVDSLQKKQIPSANKSIYQFRNSYYGFGQNLMKKYMGQVQRPYSPPLGQQQMTEYDEKQQNNQKEQVQLIYDPILNCYYDHKTHTYYELKN